MKNFLHVLPAILFAALLSMNARAFNGLDAVNSASAIGHLRHSSSAPAPDSLLIAFNLLEFHTEIYTSSIECRWTISNENNCKGYEVQRAVSGLDFTTIGWVESKPQEMKVKQYHFEDKDAEQGQLYYYRLRQIDVAGHFIVSPVVAASLDDRPSMQAQTLPDSSREAKVVQYMLARPSMITIEIADSSGKLVKKFQQGLQKPGNYTFPFSTRQMNLPEGAYTLVIWCDHQQYFLSLTNEE